MTKINSQDSILENLKNEQQKNRILSEILSIQETRTKISKKHYLILTFVVLTIISVSVSYLLVITNNSKFNIESNNSIRSNYVIENLKGDTIDTWLSWKIVPGTVLHVGIINAEKYQDKVSMIKEIISSDEIINIDDSLMHKGPKGMISTYFTGWSGALHEASKQPTELHIPTNFEIVNSKNGEGDITIILTDQSSGDGYSGYTKNIADQSQNQILKSSVTIYDVNSISDEEFKTILRHELGHVFGLAHSTASEDLMHPVIKTNYPYISQCDIDAIRSLYDGGKKSQVVCEK